MKVRIVKSYSPDTWYANLIGKEYDVECNDHKESEFYRIVAEYGYWIKIEDTAPVTDVQPTAVQPPGKKYDQGKPMYNLLPADALEEVVKVLTVGAIRYNEPIDQENWRLVDNPQTRYFAAAQRHLWADKRGEDIDAGTAEHPGTDCYHLACAISSLMFKLQLKIEQANKLKEQK